MIFYQVLRGAGNAAGNTADVSAITYFAPLLAFLVVFAIMALLLRKTKVLGDNNPFIDIFVALIIATIFVTAASVRQVVLSVIPWFAVLLIAIFFMLMMVGFLGKTDMLGKGVGWAFILLLIVIFLVAGIKVFSGVLWPYLPGPAYGSGNTDPGLMYFLDWFYSPRVIGAVLLVIVAIIVSWVLVKFSK